MDNKMYIMKKISKKLSEKLTSMVQNSVKEAYYNQSVGKSEYTNNSHWCEYNEEISNKIKSLILNIVKYRDNSNINISLKENNIFISIGNVSNIKNTVSNINNGTITISASQPMSRTKATSSSPESYLEINLLKEKGFIFNYNYNQVYFNDNKIYDSLYEIIISKYNELSSYKFNTSYKEILDISGLNREYNLENLLDTNN